MRRAWPSERSVSPVIGIILMTAIVVVLAAVATSFVLELSQEADPQPDVVLQLEQPEHGVSHALHHESGDDLVGNRTRLLGVANGNALHGNTLRAGETVEVVPVDDEVSLVWSGENTDHTLQTFDVDASKIPYSAANMDNECDWVEDDINDNGDLDMSNDEAACSVTDETDTGVSDIDIDIDSDSVLVGDIDTDGDIDVDSSDVVGGITTDSDDITITDSSSIYGDVVAQPGTNIDIDGGSHVTGDVVLKGVGSGSLSLDDIDVDGHVYADSGDISGCSSVTIGPSNQNCSEYNFKDPSSY